MHSQTRQITGVEVTDKDKRQGSNTVRDRYSEQDKLDETREGQVQ